MAEATAPLFTVNDVMAATGLTRTAIYNSIRSGRLRTIKVRSRRLIRAEDFDEWRHPRTMQAEADDGEIVELTPEEVDFVARILVAGRAERDEAAS